MELTDFRTLGRSGLRVSPLTLGATTFDNTSWGTSDEESGQIIDRYLAAGGKRDRHRQPVHQRRLVVLHAAPGSASERRLDALARACAASAAT